MMETETQKASKSTTVRIYEKTKKRLQKVARKIAESEDRAVTEIELADNAVKEYLNKEERKLGIQ